MGLKESSILNDVFIHGKGQGYDKRLEALVVRINDYGSPFWLEKCQWGQSETCWFGTGRQ